MCLDAMSYPRQCKDKQEYFLRRAAHIAARSPVCHHRHGCVIVHDGEVVSEGFNQYTTYFEHQYTMHAEIDALRKIKKTMLTECELYVVRIGTDLMGQPLKYSRPCPECTRAILKAGIKKVYFSTDDDFKDILKVFVPPPHRSRSSSDS